MYYTTPVTPSLSLEFCLMVDDKRQTLHIPVHGNKPVSVGVLSAIYKQARAYIPEEELRSYFYAD